MVVQSWTSILRSWMGFSRGTPVRRRKQLRLPMAAPATEILETRVVPTSVVSMHIDDPGVDPTQVSSLTYTVEFASSVLGVDPTDFRVITTGSVRSAATVDVVTVTNSEYKVTINNLTGSGDVRLDLIDDASISFSSDTLGLPGPFDGSFQGDTYHLLSQFPEVVSFTREAPLNATTDQPSVTWKLIFNKNVTGVDPSDFNLITTGNLQTADPIKVSGNGSTYLISVTGLTGTGDVSVDMIDDQSIRDLNGNPLAATGYTTSFQFMGGIVAGPAFTSVQMADLNGDHVPDYIFTYRDTAQIGVCLANPSFTVQGLPVTYNTGNFPLSLQIADINGDGILDLINANKNSNSISILKGNGDGTFQGAQFIPVGGSPSAVTLGDLNGDGFPELVVAVQSANSVLIIQNNKSGFSVGPLIEVDSAPSGVAVGDVTGDGLNDIVVSNRDSNTIKVLEQTGNGPFIGQPSIPTGAAPVAIELDDINHDGFLDIVTANSGDDTVTVVQGFGIDGFSNPVNFPTGSQPSAIALEDVNSDGQNDVLVTDSGGTGFSVLTGNGDGTFQLPQDFMANDSSNGVSLADVDGDGHVDVITSSTTTRGIVPNRNAETGAVTSPIYTIVASGPIITSPGDFAVSENYDTTVPVFNVIASDSGGNSAPLTYSISGIDKDDFTIDSATGSVFFVNSPDYENPIDNGNDNVYDFVVTVSDGSGSVSQNITVTVLPQNEFPIELNVPPTLQVDENTPASTVLFDVDASEQDLPPTTYFYSLEQGGDSALFSINSTTGELFFRNSPDYENPLDADGDNVYHITIRVDGSQEEFATADVDVAVQPVNDNLPVITSASTASENENTSETAVVLDVDATDADLPTQTLTYGISGIDATFFNIDSATGEIRFNSSPDYEAPADNGQDNTYDITVTVSDGFGGSTSQDIQISVFPIDDNLPVYQSSAAVTVTEGIPASAVVLDVEATDADLPPRGFFYSIFGVDAESFTIDSATGEIRFINSPSFSAPEDSDGDNVYHLTVSTDPENFLTGTQDITITVEPLSHLPQITSPNTASIDENSPVSTVVLDVNATDPDIPAQTLTYSLSGIDAARFQIDSATGEIRFLSVPDFENPTDANGDNQYDITVTVSDGVDGSTQQDITILVLNVNEPPVPLPGALALLEDTPASGVLNVDNPDGTSLRFNIDQGPAHGSVAFDSNTGEYTYTPDPDYNGADSFTFVVFYIESTSESATIDITIGAVNDAPVFVKGPDQNVFEDTGTHDVPNWATNIAAGPATATDEVGQTLTFSVTNDNNALFTKQPTVDAAGHLTYTLAPNAFGTANVKVILSDNGGTANGGVDTSATQTFAINITNVNDVPVVNDQSFNVRENAVVGQVVGTVTVLDVDPGDSHFYAITNGNSAGAFAINPTTGQITVANPALLAGDPHPVFHLVVQVTDSAETSDSANITINVVDALVITFGGTIQTYVKTSGVAAIDPATIARDALVPNINYNEGALTVTINNPEQGDRLGVLTRGNGSGRISILHNNIIFESSLQIVGQIVSGLNGGPLVIKLTSFATEAAIDALLQTISFRNTSSSTHEGTRSITFDLTNRVGDEHDTKTTQLVVASRSIPPTFTVPPGDVNYVNLAAPVILTPDATVTDVDSQNLNGGQLSVAITQAGRKSKGKHKLSVAEIGGITLDGKDVWFDGFKIGHLSTRQNGLTVAFNTINATFDAVQALVRAIAFSTTSGNTNLADRVVQFTLSDGVQSQTASKTVHVQ